MLFPPPTPPLISMETRKYSQGRKKVGPFRTEFGKNPKFPQIPIWCKTKKMRQFCSSASIWLFFFGITKVLVICPGESMSQSTVCRKVSHGIVFNVFVQIVCFVQVVCNICMSELSALSILSALSALSVRSIVSRFEFDENCDVEKSLLCYLWAQEVCP